MIRTRLGLKLITAVFPLLLTACFDGSSGAEGGATVLPGEDDPGIEQNAESSSPNNFVFQFQQEFADSSNKVLLDFLDIYLGRAVIPFNRIDNIFLNTTIPVEYGACGESNVFYSPSEQSIILCDEFGSAALDYFLSFLEGSDEEELFALEQSVNVMTFFLYHAMAHALEDISDLAVRGDFELFADAIGVVLSVQTGQPLAAIDGGFFYMNDTDGSFADQHGVGEDRAGNVLCWVLGSDSLEPAAFPELLAAFVDAGRDCTSEYDDQFQLVSQAIPNLNSIAPVISTRGMPAKGKQDGWAAGGKVLVDLLQD